MTHKSLKSVIYVNMYHKAINWRNFWRNTFIFWHCFKISDTQFESRHLTKLFESSSKSSLLSIERTDSKSLLSSAHMRVIVCRTTFGRSLVKLRKSKVAILRNTARY